VTAFTAALAALFVVASFALNPLCGALSPVALAIVFGYSYMKRITWASHLVLGLSLAMAPMGGWLAIAGRFDAIPCLLAVAVVFWVAGFDTIYACQDEGSTDALTAVSRQHFRALLPCHGAALVAMAAVGVAAELHPVYWAGVVVVAGVLVWEHRLVRVDDLSKLGVAFLNANGLISLVYFGVVLVALAFGRRAP
jgi:4-hydroxybenzoate polyprenyltransferase